MLFLDDNHKSFYEELTEKYNPDVYMQPVIYLMGLSSETRSHNKDIFDLDKRQMKIEGLNKPWQTGSSLKITRLAFNLWNSCMYDSQEDYEENKISYRYGVDEIFCCGYAPYFYEAIKLRYPEYTNL